MENDAGGPVLDASPEICRELTGGSSCGWSDHLSVHVAQALAPEVDGVPLGPFTVNETEFANIVATGKKLEEERQWKLHTDY